VYELENVWWLALEQNANSKDASGHPNHAKYREIANHD
jgi:hypothetical protein